MNKSKKSSQSGSPHLLRNSENSSRADKRKEASDSAQSAVQVPVVNQVNVPTNVIVRGRRKMNLKKPQKNLDSISTGPSDPSIASVRTLNSKVWCSPTISVWKLDRLNLKHTVSYHTGKSVHLLVKSSSKKMVCI